MTSDLLAYLSGRLPLGIALVPLVGGAFTVVWWWVWKGTGFWGRRRLWVNLGLGWVLILSLYSCAWVLFRPPPLPVRVVVTPLPSAAADPAGWRLRLAADAVERRLDASPRAFALQRADFVPALQRTTDESLEPLAHRLAVSRLVLIEPDTSASERIGKAFSAVVKKRRGGGFTTIAAFRAPGVAFRTEAVRVAEQVAAALGDKTRPESWPGRPIPMPDSSYRALDGAVRLADSGDPDSAWALLELLSDRHPGWGRVWQERAALDLRLHAAMSADRIYDDLLTALEVDPGDPLAFLLLGRMSLLIREWNEAEAALKLAFNANPDDPRILFYLARLSPVRYNDLAFKSRREMLDRALALSPGYEAARLMLVSDLRAELARRPAYRILAEGLALDPESTALMLAKSAVELELSLNADAARTCRRILELNPGEPEALYNLGIALVWLEDYDRAIAFLDSSYRAGGDPDNLYYIGVAFVRQKNWRQALKYFQMRMANPKSRTDKVAISAREMVKKLKGWIADEEAGAGGD